MSHLKKNGKKRAATAAISLLLAASMCLGFAGCGTEGPAGPAGPQGPQGIQGPAGPAGADGADGSAAAFGDVYSPSGVIKEGKVTPTGTKSGNLAAKGNFSSDYVSMADAKQAGEALNIEIASEGFTLLKNKDNALPLTKSERDVTLFGARSANLQYVGGGSGAGDGSGKTYTMQDSMEDAGFRVNKKLLGYYASANQSTEIKPSKYVGVLGDTIKSYGDAVLWTISRTGQEGSDLKRSNVAGHADATEHYLELDDNEKEAYAFLKQLKEEGSIKKLIIVVNSANAMELGDMQDEDLVDSIIWIGHVGDAGIMALGKILNGEVNPSGHLADTYARDFKLDPSWNHIGDSTQVGEDNIVYYKEDDELVKSKFRSSEYREGIYVGYRYYETVAADKDAAKKGDGENWYEQNVVYPFGYGLSYTNFEWKIDNVATTGKIGAANETVTMRVWVKNIGNVAGKDVVQTYYSAPYTKGGIEKSAVNLVSFAKTKLLQPGESQVLTMQFAAQDMASYDYNDKNNNGFKGYELEKGNYTISVRRNSHDVVDSITRTVDSTIKCETDLQTGAKIQNIFSGENGLEDFKSTTKALLDNEMTRNNGLALTKASSKEDRTMTQEQVQAYYDTKFYYSYQDTEKDPWYVKSTPAGWDQATPAQEAARKDGLCAIPLSAMSGIEYSDPTKDAQGNLVSAKDEGTAKWDEFMNQLTWSEMVKIVTYGYYMGAGLDSVGMVSPINGDGPAQLKAGWFRRDMPGGTLWACATVISSTFNQDLAEQYGKMVGNESILLNESGWYGPSMDIHRSPFSGRNFEYYSEDGIHAGLIAAAAVKGATEKGVSCFIKHTMLNDSETARSTEGGVMTWASEQAIREVFAKPFEYAIKFGGSTGYMTGMNRIGAIPCAANYALNEALIRQEWGFTGASCTDTHWGNDNYSHFNIMVRSGIEIPLGPSPKRRGGEEALLDGSSDMCDSKVLTWCIGDPDAWDSEAKCVKVKADADGTTTMLSPTHYYAVRKSAQRILYMSANCNDMSIGDRYVVSAKNMNANVALTDSERQRLDGTAGEQNYVNNTYVYSTASDLHGLTLSAEGVLTGTVSGITENFVVTVNVVITNPAGEIMHFSYDVTVIV